MSGTHSAEVKLEGKIGSELPGPAGAESKLAALFSSNVHLAIPLA